MVAILPDEKPANLTLKQAVIVKPELHICHVRALTLLGVLWLVTDKTVGDPMLGRHVLEALRLNAQDILSSAALIHSCVVEVSSLFACDTSSQGKSPAYWKECITMTVAKTMMTSTRRIHGFKWVLNTEN